MMFQSDKYQNDVARMLEFCPLVCPGAVQSQSQLHAARHQHAEGHSVQWHFPPGGTGRRLQLLQGGLRTSLSYQGWLPFVAVVAFMLPLWVEENSIHPLE